MEKRGEIRFSLWAKFVRHARESKEEEENWKLSLNSIAET